MVISRITDLDLPEGVTHVSTDWQIAEDLLFSNVVLESTNDSDNLTYIVFPDQLDPEVKYYGRARVVLSTGYTEWGNINVFVVKDINDISADEDYPSLVSLPVLYTDSDYSNHKPTLFKMMVDNFGVIGTGIHTATSWFITDLSGNMVWDSFYDNNNLEEITISSILLKENSIYRLHAVFHTSSNDNSQMVTKTIHVNSVPEVVLLTSLNNLDLSIDNLLEISYIPLMTSVEWNIVEIVDGYVDNAYSLTNSDDPLTQTLVESYTLELDKFYLLTIKVLTSDRSGISEYIKYIPFTTYGAYLTNEQVQEN